MPLQCIAGWLICGKQKVLLRAVECLVELRIFLIGQGKAYFKLENEKWLVNLMSLSDITTPLNVLNFHVQCPKHTVINLLVAGKAFVAKPAVLSRSISTANCRYFKHLKKISVDH